MSDNVSARPPHHVGMPGINSPGYAPPKNSPEHEEATSWEKKYNEWLTSTIGKGDKSE